MLFMKMKEKILSLALVLLPLSLIGMAFSYFTGKYHAMFFWGILVSITFIAVGVMPSPHRH